MKARTKIEKQVAASNEKLTAISPKVLTWAVRKVAEHVCFRTSTHKCTCYINIRFGGGLYLYYI